jgi:hypothetical protein
MGHPQNQYAQAPQTHPRIRPSPLHHVQLLSPAAKAAGLKARRYNCKAAGRGSPCEKPHPVKVGRTTPTT